MIKLFADVLIPPSLIRYKLIIELNIVNGVCNVMFNKTLLGASGKTGTIGLKGFMGYTGPQSDIGLDGYTGPTGQTGNLLFTWVKLIEILYCLFNQL